MKAVRLTIVCVLALALIVVVCTAIATVSIPGSVESICSEVIDSNRVIYDKPIIDSAEKDTRSTGSEIDAGEVEKNEVAPESGELLTFAVPTDGGTTQTEPEKTGVGLTMEETDASGINHDEISPSSGWTEPVFD
ncbi:hypothetical protein [Olsenella sp. An285]|uniref:hypothetical protein n=1 Tax=Olsenella sp. An285 TaxID=1965621 RepID=UPI00117F3E3F|nr:hypothetical protein [Olsenella sp. An285]